MIFSKRVYSGLSAAVAAGVFLAGGLAGCSGGGGTTVAPVTPAMPNAPVTAPQGGERLLATLDVDRAAAGEAARTVISASAHKLRLRNELPQNAQRSVQSFYDLNNHGGPTMLNGISYNIYVNCAGTCWGSPSPGTFLGYLGASTFIHVTDQYIGSTANNRYTYGGGYQVNYSTTGTLGDADMANIVHAVAVTNGGGYGKEYHVFFQQGVKECSTLAGGCYAVSGGYCAYHASADFSDVGHTLYSFEGYQNIAGCQVSGTSPNGVLVDSTASTLSHEFFETITDPDLNAWWNSNTGEEIGDLCATSDGIVSVNGHNYNLQREYSNRYHGCTFSP